MIGWRESASIYIPCRENKNSIQHDYENKKYSLMTNFYKTACWSTCSHEAVRNLLIKCEDRERITLSSFFSLAQTITKFWDHSPKRTSYFAKTEAMDDMIENGTLEQQMFKYFWKVEPKSQVLRRSSDQGNVFFSKKVWKIWKVIIKGENVNFGCEGSSLWRRFPRSPKFTKVK